MPSRFTHQFVRPGLDARAIAEKDRLSNLLFNHFMTSAQDFFVVALREHNLPWVGLGFVNHGV